MSDCPAVDEITWAPTPERLLQVVESQPATADPFMRQEDTSRDAAVCLGMREWVWRLEQGHAAVNQDGERVASRLRRAEEIERRNARFDKWRK